MSAIIADDEPLAREELRFLLNDIGDVEVVGVASNGLEALDLIEKLDPALAFLDIQMPGLDGLGVVRRLRENHIDPPHIIFSTAFEQFAVEAFRLEAMDYLLKPVDRERLGATLARARRAVADRITEPIAAPASKPAFTKLLVRSGNRNLVISPEELVYATIANGVISLVAAHAEGQSNFRTLEELQAALDPDMFWRAHRSYLVNVNRIREVVPWFKSTYQLRMDDKKVSEIPVSPLQSRRSARDAEPLARSRDGQHYASLRHWNRCRFAPSKGVEVNSMLKHTLIGAALLALSVIPQLRADEFNKKTVMTFSAPVDVSGESLPAGTYVFKTLPNDRSIVVVMNSDETHLVGLFSTIETSTPVAPDETRVVLTEGRRTHPK